MVRLLTLLALSATALADDPGDASIRLGAEISVSATDTSTPWLEQGLGKLFADDDGLAAHRFFVDYSGRVTDTLSANLVADAYNDRSEADIGVTEAYLRWRPVPKSRYRLQARLGLFYPSISLENDGPGWSNTFTNTFSAINAWVAEEIRTLGLEIDVSRTLNTPLGKSRLGLSTSVFTNNDPAGALLAWRGWSLHDRQVRWNESLPLAALPSLQAGSVFEGQADGASPLKQVDDNAGYTVAARWNVPGRFDFHALHYDNRADPLVLENGQYGWGTRFDSLALRTSLPGQVRLIAQWMDGSTQMGSVTNDWHAVDNPFRSHFVLLNRRLGDNSVSFRFDDFHVRDRDNTPMDSNAETGRAMTIAWRYFASPGVELVTEWLEIRSTRPARAYFNEDPYLRETRLTMNIRVTFSL